MNIIIIKANWYLQEYAATAMSELLGWYGYEKVDSGCTRGLNLDHFGSSVTSRHNNRTRDGAVSSGSPTQTKRSSRSPISCRPSRFSPTSLSVSSYKDNGSIGGHRPSSPASSLQTGPASPRALDNSDSASDTPGNYNVTCYKFDLTFGDTPDVIYILFNTRNS